MDSFLSDVISGAIVAAAGGAAFLAYKHPKGYRRLSDQLNRATSVVGVAVSSWMLALTFAKMQMERLLAPAEAKAANAVLQSMSPPLWAVIAFFLIYLYIMTLRLLPRIRSDGDKEDEADEEATLRG